MNGGPMFTFTEAISLLINCADQDEIDYYWEKLTEGGEEGQCGWLKDKFGLSWQVCPIGWEAMFDQRRQGSRRPCHRGDLRHEEARRRRCRPRSTARGDVPHRQAVPRQLPMLQSTAPGGWTYVVMPGSAEYFGTRAW